MVLSGNGEFLVRFWGVRGSIACPGPETLRYGGNTSCIEIRCGGRPLILDAGTGLRGLGEALSCDGPTEADILFTHTHFDHISGIPFFRPMFAPGNTFRLHAGHLLPKHTLREVLCELMMAPLFPVPMKIMGADISFSDFRSGESFELGCGARVATAPLNHPNHATGYRVEYGGKSVCYVTDTEHREDGLDSNILRLIEGTDYFIYDSMFTDDEYPKYRGWGHSTWQQGAELADAAGVKTFVIFHHDPSHDDTFMDAIAAAAQHRRPGTIVAREGMELVV